MTEPSENTEKALATLPGPKRGRYDDAVKDLCFQVWLFQADRNAEETRRILEGELTEFSGASLPNLDRIPTARQIQLWVKNEHWAQRGNDLIRNTAEHIDESQIARLFIISDEAISFARELIRGDYDMHPKPGNLAVRWDAAKEMLRFRGLGTAGVVGAPTLEVKVVNDLDDRMKALSIDEKAEMLREATLKEKELKRLTGKRN